MKRRTKKIIKQASLHLLVNALLLSVLFFFALSAWNAYKKYSFAKSNLVLIQNKHEDLKERNLILKEKIKNLSDSFGKETLLRDRYLYAKEGEKLLIIPESFEISENTQKSETKEKGLLEKIKNIFKL